MKKAFFALSLLIVGTAAQAETLSVEFWPCSNNQNYICAQVYESGAPQEMSIEASDDVVEQIAQRMTVAGHSLATNVDGTIVRVNKLMGGQYSKLEINSLDSTSSSSRPR